MANSSYVEYINKISEHVTHYSNIISIAVGVPLNLINVIVFTRLMLNKTNKTNMGFLGLCQSIIDIVHILYISLLFRSTSLLPVNLIRKSDSICKFLNLIRRVLSGCTSWMQVVSTFDRFIFVIFGHGGRLRFMKHKRYLALIIFCVLILLSLTNIINLFFYISNGKCTADNSILVASDLIFIITKLYIPIFFMIFFNVYMVRIVIKKSRTALRQTSNLRKEYQFTVAVIANDTFFLLFYLPISVYTILYDFNLYSGAFNGDPLLAATYNLSGNVFKDFSFCIQTFSFFIYLAFNKLYRRELLNHIFFSNNNQCFIFGRNINISR